MEITSCFQWSRIAPFNPVRFLIDDSRRGNRSIGEHRQVRRAGSSYLLSLWIEAICTQLARPSALLPHGQPARVSRHSRLRHPGGAVESISYPIESQSSKWTSKGQYWNESLRNLSRRCTEDACWNAWGGGNISKNAYTADSRSFVRASNYTIKIFFCRLWILWIVVVVVVEFSYFSYRWVRVEERVLKNGTMPSHEEYVFDCIQDATCGIRGIKWFQFL